MSAILKKYRQWPAMVMATLMIAGCAATTSHPPHPDTSVSRTTGGTTGPSAATEMANAPNSLSNRLHSKVRQWEGTPHKLGGTSRRGIDCSAFVQMLYRDILKRQIPRSTTQQVKSGRSIAKKQLDVGDLVFFRIPYNKRHVGIYLGEAKFAHASTSKGVMISDLNSKYWRKMYWTARRYLQ